MLSKIYQTLTADFIMLAAPSAPYTVLSGVPTNYGIFPENGKICLELNDDQNYMITHLSHAENLTAPARESTLVRIFGQPDPATEVTLVEEIETLLTEIQALEVEIQQLMQQLEERKLELEAIKQSRVEERDSLRALLAQGPSI